MRSFYVKSDNPIYLGRVGENDATQVIFDISYMVNKFGEGTVSLIAQREGDTDPYPCVIERSGNKVTWKITNADNARAGKGSCELRYMVGDTIAKSEVWETIVWESLGEHGDSVPEPYQSWVDQVLEAASKIGSAARANIGADGVEWIPTALDSTTCSYFANMGSTTWIKDMDVAYSIASPTSSNTTALNRAVQYLYWLIYPDNISNATYGGYVSDFYSNITVLMDAGVVSSNAMIEITAHNSRRITALIQIAYSASKKRWDIIDMRRRGCYMWIVDGVVTYNSLPYYYTDDTLSISGRPADAKATGDAIAAAKTTAETAQTTAESAQSTAESALSGLAEKITAPQTAEVGQVISVKAVDDEGRPIEWEAVGQPRFYYREELHEEVAYVFVPLSELKNCTTIFTQIYFPETLSFDAYSEKTIPRIKIAHNSNWYNGIQFAYITLSAKVNHLALSGTLFHDMKGKFFHVVSSSRKQYGANIIVPGTTTNGGKFECNLNTDLEALGCGIYFEIYNREYPIPAGTICTVIGY